MQMTKHSNLGILTSDLMEFHLQAIMRAILYTRHLLIGWGLPLALLASFPFSAQLNARDITLGTIPEKMRFDQEFIQVKPSESITLTLVNTCRMQHNWILCQPGKNSTLQVAIAALQLGAEAISKQYAPDSPLVIIATPIVNPNETKSIQFKAPSTPGRYPYVCTLPGHAATMKGILLVGDVAVSTSAAEPPISNPTTGLERAQEKMKIYRPLMDGGPTFAGVIANGEDITPKGIAVRLGESGSAGALFDTELMRYSAA
jgi:azurin